MAQNWPKMSQKSPKMTQMAQKLAPAKKIAEIYLQYLPLFAFLPACGLNTYAPEGEASADIVAAFAEDHDLWAETFLEAWAKLQTNGYDPEQLTVGPENSWLLASSLDS